jgi:hypothetical protein
VSGDNIIPLRRIPVLTQAEVESIRTPEDIIRIVEAQPNRKYRVVRGQEPVSTPEVTLPERRRRHSAILQAICLGGAGYAFGISSASCIIHLAPLPVMLATASAIALYAAGWWVCRFKG